MTDSYSKTLIIRFSSVGDIVLSSLLVRAFHSRFPDCQLDFVVKEEFADLVRYNPHITTTITFPRNGTFDDLKRLRDTVKQNRYDLIIDIHDSLRSRYVSAGARKTLRLNKRKFARFLLVKCKWRLYEAFGGAPNVAERYLEPVQSLGVENDGKGLELFVSGGETTRMQELVHDAGHTPDAQFIGICPSAKHNTKMWLKERFAETAQRLSNDHKQAIVLFGSKDERARCTEIEEMLHTLDPEIPTLNLAGKISLAETAAMMDSCSLIITNDTGLMHIASARKRKVVAIFGSTVKEFGFFPFGTESVVVENSQLNCRPCTHIGLAECPKGHFKCMNDLSTAHVVAAAHNLVQCRPS